MPYLLLLVGCLGLTLSIIGLYIPFIQQLDINAVTWMDQYRSSFFNGIAVFLSYFGGLPSMLLLFSLWCFRQFRLKKYANIILIYLSLLGNVVIGWTLKYWFNRPRPELIYQMIETYGASFPSGHSIYAGTLSCLVMLIYHKHHQKKLIVFFACLWFILMGVSRVYLGAHYPTDVLAGWSIAFIWVTILWLVLKFIQSKNKLFLEKNLNEVE